MLEVTTSGTLRVAIVSVMAATVSNCAITPSTANFVRATPVNSPVAPLTAADGFYGGAVAAIDRRDYGRALELLQRARQGKAADVRVLNALGVVYDKLGRFDLSRRYYAEAAAADPTSNIVQSNIAYSERLRDQGPRGEIQLAAAPILKVLPTSVAKPKAAVQPAVPRGLQPRTDVTAIERRAAEAAPAPAALPSPPSAAVEARPPLASAALARAVQRTAAKPSAPMDASPGAVAAQVARAVPLANARPREGAVFRASAAATPRPAQSTQVTAIEPGRPIAERPRSTTNTTVVRPAVAAVSMPRLRVAAAPPPRATIAPATPQVARRFAGLVTSVRPPLRIINASGEIRRAEPIRSSLASLGWSAPRWAVMETRVQARSVIYYPASRVAVARALASTLPGTTRLVPCTNGCGGLQLVLGSDARGWKPMRRRLQSA